VRSATAIQTREPARLRGLGTPAPVACRLAHRPPHGSADPSGDGRIIVRSSETVSVNSAVACDVGHDPRRRGRLSWSAVQPGSRPHAGEHRCDLGEHARLVLDLHRQVVRGHRVLDRGDAVPAVLDMAGPWFPDPVRAIVTRSPITADAVGSATAPGREHQAACVAGLDEMRCTHPAPTQGMDREHRRVYRTETSSSCSPTASRPRALDHVACALRPRCPRCDRRDALAVDVRAATSV